MKIAIGTDDKKTIRKGHFGQSIHFLIIEFLNGEMVSREYRQNADVTSEHGQVEKILELLSDCSLFMGKRTGKTSLAELTAYGIDCIMTEIDSILSTRRLNNIFTAGMKLFNTMTAGRQN